MTQAKGKLGFWMCTALVTGNMIASGIFLLPASLAHLGGMGMIGWLVTTAGAFLLAGCFCFLSRVRPAEGGIYVYAREGFGDFIGFQVAWGYWVATWAAIAAIAVAFVGYLGAFIPILTQQPVLGAAAAIAAIWILTAVNLLGVRQAGRTQLATTIIKLIPLLGMALIGPFFADLSHFTPIVPEGQSPLGGLSAAAALTLWAYLGLEAATIPAEDVDDPARTIPRATLTGVMICAVVYIFGTFAVMGLVPPDQLANSPAPFAAAAAKLGGEPARIIVVFGALTATFGALNGWILIGGHLPTAPAKDGLLPASLAQHSDRGVPWRGVVISSVAASLIAVLNFSHNLVDQFTFIILLSTMATLIPYVFCTLSALIIGVAGPSKPGKGFVAMTLLGFAYSMWAVAGSGAEAVFWGFLLLTAGAPIYAWQRIKSS